jgi:Tol biopolymer transport system component
VPVTAPPRPPRPTDPVDREELEALIEEARQRAQRRRRRNAALATLIGLVAVAVFGIVGLSAESESASPALAAGSNTAAQPVTLRLAFTSSTRGDGVNRNVPNPPPLKPVSHELYVVNADGTDKRLLAQRTAMPVVTQGVWLPDGQTIAFLGFSNRVLLVNADGSGQQNVKRAWTAWRGGLPDWSPDGESIAFVKSRCCGQKSDIYVMNTDGSGVRRLTRGNGSLWPMWSPTGKQIAFTRMQWRPQPGRTAAVVWAPEVWVMNADGSGQRRLALGMPSAWSPDGQRIAFTRPAYTVPHAPGMYVVNADGTGQRRLNTVNFGSAEWSPDGQKILFVRARPGTRSKVNDIYVMNADGSGQRKLTERGHDPRWSSDCTKISFVTNRDGNDEIYVMNADGHLIEVGQTSREFLEQPTG